MAKYRPEKKCVICRPRITEGESIKRISISFRAVEEIKKDNFEIIGNLVEKLCSTTKVSTVFNITNELSLRNKTFGCLK
jgi:NADPH-dependent 7-cyano-7-deazaguanine reductase QueF